MYDYELDEYWDWMLDNNIVSEETLQIVTDINGYSVETLNDILYAATGYRNREQYMEYME